MHDAPRESKQALIEKIVSYVHKNLPEQQSEQAAEFVRRYYGFVAPDDMLERSVIDLYGAVLAHWNFLRQRTVGTPKIRVYNPRFDEHGWQSTHTIVELVTDDMPFLVDSVRMELNRHALTVHLIIHMTATQIREPGGRMTKMLQPREKSPAGAEESIMHVEIDRQTDAGMLRTLTDDLTRVLGDVRRSVTDWPRMRDTMRTVASGLEDTPPPLSPQENAESKAFLEWATTNHFTFLGYRKYDLVRRAGDNALKAVPGSGLGILAEDKDDPVSRSFAALPLAVRELAHKPELLVIAKASSKSTVHRPVAMDYIGVKRFDETGVCGEHRFLGLYTSVAYRANPHDIPMLRTKVQNVIRQASLSPTSHAGKDLANILETFPRDDLFQISESELYDIAIGILQLQDRHRTRLFVRPDTFQRFMSCLVFVPRERYSTAVRRQMQKILKRAFNGIDEPEFSVSLTESVLARIRFMVRTSGDIPQWDLSQVEAQLIETTQTWEDNLQTVLLEQLGEEVGSRLFQRYGEAFPAGYREDCPARIAVHDIQHMERLESENGLVMTLYRPLEAPAGWLRFKIYSEGQTVTLSEALPILENMGVRVVDERPYKVERRGQPPVWIHDFGMSHAEDLEIDTADVKDIFQETFASVWRGEIDNDRFNRLVLSAGLATREITVLRAYCKYLLQSSLSFSQAYIEQTVAANPGVALLLIELFRTRFDPALQQHNEPRIQQLSDRLGAELDSVASLDEDRILRSFVHVLWATQRTNYFQIENKGTGGTEGQNKRYLSFKFDSAKIPELPKPRPMYEIFVYSARTEGVHLRGGKVARGGIRWSDRREDYRTEVLGLMKAQMVKNALIVPVGAKGGFVVKRPPGDDRKAMMEEVQACYGIFIRGLLDISDNRVGDEIVSPQDVVRYDEDDPYLVVAADKGTATFSDIANGIAQEYGFWLDDAFASGGSTGYDHKGMGITAAGAWESVKQHFRAMSIDIQSTPFTVVGVGDMSGDVFGNGMLLSRHIKLLAAFDHRHIFLDPDPDPADSYKERERMFALPRSSWEDYDTSFMSEGGGIFPRTAKSIPLSPQVKQMLGVDVDGLAPNDLINTLLKMRVHLLWNGGIGTYVKASTETHADAGDRSNDATRVNAAELRCQVVGEGGNLGLTQLARIEYARQGGRIDADFIHNAGGVDCSDHEVNIKILLNQVVANGDMTVKQRNQLLAEMTDEVGELVLLDNYWQTQAISLDEARAPILLEEHQRFMRALERADKMDRALEYLPTDEQIAELLATDEGLCRPEIATLTTYAKMTTYEELVDSDLPEDPYLRKELERYFPKPLRKQFREQMEAHRLRREIVATFVTNRMINRLGSTFVHKLKEETGASAADIARAYTVVWEVFNLRELWTRIAALDNKVSADVQTRMMNLGGRLITRASLWFLHNRPRPLDIELNISEFQEGASTLAEEMSELLALPEQEALAAEAEEFVDAGVPQTLAWQVVSLDALYCALDILEVTRSNTLEVRSVAATYFSLGARLRLNWLRSALSSVTVENHWQSRARTALNDDLYAMQKALTGEVLWLGADFTSKDAQLGAWFEKNQTPVERCLQTFTDLSAQPSIDLAMLSVALREIHNLVQSSASIPLLTDVRAPDAHATAPDNVAKLRIESSSN